MRLCFVTSVTEDYTNLLKILTFFFFFNFKKELDTMSSKTFKGDGIILEEIP